MNLDTRKGPARVVFDKVTKRYGTSTVAAQAVTQAPAAGNMPFQTVTKFSDVTRDDVRTDLQMARANGDLPANGEIL